MKKISLPLILFVGFCSCNASQKNDEELPSEPNITVKMAGFDEQKTEDYSFNMLQPLANSQGQLEKGQRKIIWTANLEFQVDDVDRATEKIGDLVAKNGGAITQMNAQNNPSEHKNFITIRVDNASFSTMVKSLKKEAKSIREERLSSEDVSEEYVDIEARLKTKKEVRNRYVEILRTKTGKITEILEVEEAIRKITEEIEVQEGRLRFLNDQIDQSTIYLNLVQKVTYEEPTELFEESYSSKLGEGIRSGWSGITGLFLGLVKIWPLSVIFILFIIWQRKRISAIIRKLNLTGK